jgi:hypothetical protein
MRMIAKVGQWFDRRLQLAAPIREAVGHPIPRKTASWWYVFGSAALTVFLLQVVTGILLALIYVPSASEAWSSLQALNHQVALGWFIRAMHGWGSNFMVAIVLIHMAQVFLFGAYSVVSMGHHYGFVEHPYSRNGRTYVSRTYVINGHTYARAYSTYYYHGAYFYHYAPAYYYVPAFYGWAYSPWAAPVYWQWSW